MSLLDDMLANAGIEYDNSNDLGYKDQTDSIDDGSGDEYTLPELPSIDEYGIGGDPFADEKYGHGLPDDKNLYSFERPKSISDIKSRDVEEKATNKAQSIEEKTYMTKRKLGIMSDEDSGRFSNGQGWRAKGFDAYEVFHPDQLKSNKIQSNGKTMGENTRARLDRQKDRYAKQFGVPREDVTDEMIYKKGYEGMFDAYRELAGLKGTKDDFDPTKIDYSAYSDKNIFPEKPMTLGTKEHPLDIAIAQQRRKDGYVDVDGYDREITTFLDPKTGENINDKLSDRYNLVAFDENGYFDKTKVEDMLAEKLNWPGNKPSEMTDPEEIARWKVYSSDEEQDLLDRWSGVAKSATLNALGNVVEFARQAHLIDDTKENRDDINKLIGKSPKDQAWRDAWAGLQANSRADKDETYDKAKKLWAKEKGVWNVSTAKSLPEFASGVADSFSESTPEMAMIMISSPFMVLNRTVMQDKDFYAKNKRHFNEKEMYIMAAWNAANIYAEKMGLEFGVKEFLKLLGPKAAKSWLGKSAKGALGISGGALFEFLQENSEGTADAFANQKADKFTLERAAEIAQDPETTAQAMQGAFTGGAMAATGAGVGNTYAYGKEKIKPAIEAVGNKVGSAIDELKSPYDNGQRDFIESEQGQDIHDNRITPLFNDLADILSSAQNEDGMVDMEMVDISPEDAEVIRNNALDAAVEINDLPAETDADLIERGKLAAYLYTTIFSDPNDNEDIDMSELIFAGDDISATQREQLHDFLVSEMEASAETINRREEQAKAEAEQEINTDEEVNTEPEPATNDNQDTEDNVGSDTTEDTTTEDYTNYSGEEKSGPKSSNGEQYEDEIQYMYHEHLSQPFDPNTKENKKELKKAEKNGDYEFIGNPEIRSQYEEMWSQKNNGKEAKSALYTAADMNTKKNLDSTFGEFSVENTVNENTENTQEPTTDDTASEDTGTNDSKTIADELREFDMNSKDRDEMTPDEYTQWEKDRGEILKKLDEARSKEDTKEDESKDTAEEQTDSTDTTDDGPLNAMTPELKGNVNVQKITTESGSVIQKGAGKRKTDKRVAGFIPDGSFLSTFVYGSTDKKGMKKVKFSAQQKSGSTKTILGQREEMVAKLYNTISNNIGKLHKTAQKTFNALTTNKDGTKKSEDDQMAIAGRLSILAMHKVIEDIKSNIDRTIGENNLPLEGMYALRQNIAKEIGRAFVESYGLQVVPKTDSKEDNQALNEYYIQLGNLGLELAKDMGYIETLKKDQSIFDTGYHKQYSENNKDVKYEQDAKKPLQTEELMGTSVPLVYGEDVITVPEKYLGFSGIKGNESSADVQSSISSTIASVLKALLPANERQPESYPSTAKVQPRGHDNEISDTYQDTIEAIRSGKIFIDPNILEPLHEVAKEMQRTGKRVNQIMHQKKYRWLKNMFDMEVKKDISPAEQLSAKGKYISRFALAESVMQMFLDNMNSKGDLDSNFNEVFFTYFKALNERAHVDEIPFNFQADNMFSRHALVPSTGESGYKFEGKDIKDKEWKKDINYVIVDTLSDEMGITPEEVVDGSVTAGTDSDYLNAINEVIEDYVNDGDIPGFMSDENIKKHKVLFDHFKSPLHLWRLLNGVNDTRKAYSESGSVETMNVSTDYSPEFDANNSGFINKLLNALGSLNSDTRKEIMKMLKSLTIRDSKSNDVGDAYNMLTEKIKKKINELKKEAENKKSDEFKKKIDLLEKIVDFIDLAEGEKGMRNLSKYPLLAGIYGQGEASLARNLGIEITKSIMSYGKSNENTKVMDEAYKILNKSPSLLTRSDIRVISQSIGEIMGEIYTEGLNQLEKPINDENKIIEDAYKELEKAALFLDSDLTLRSPFEVVISKVMPRDPFVGKNIIDAVKNAEFVFSIMKRKNVVPDHKTTIEGPSDIYATEQKFMPNPNSIKVIPLHAIDTAVMLLAYVKTMRELERRGVDMGGSMPIHDAVIGSPEFMEVYRRMYNEAALDVAANYDIKNETSMLIDRMIDGLKNYKSKTGYTVKPEPLIESLEKINAELKRDNDQRMKNKQDDIDFLRNKGAVVFGTTKHYTEFSSNETQPLQEKSSSSEDSNSNQSKRTTDEDAAVRESEHEEIASIPGRLERESKANEGINFFEGPTEKNSEMEKPPTQDEFEHNNDRIDFVINSGEPYIAIDLETTFGQDNASEIVQLAAGMYSRDTELESVSKFYLPSNAYEYTKNIAKAAIDKAKYYLKYSDINENAEQGTTKKIPGEKSEFNRTRSKNANANMKKALAELKERIKKLREDIGIPDDQKIPLIAFNGMTFDFQILMSNLGENILDDFELLDATWLAFEQKNNDESNPDGGKPIDGTTEVKYTSLKWFMDKNNVEMEDSVEAEHDARYDIGGMVKAIVNYVKKDPQESTEAKIDETWEKANSTSIRDLINTLTSSEPREVMVEKAKILLNNMIDSGILSEDGKKHAEDLIGLLEHGDFNAIFEQKIAWKGGFEYKDNVIDTTKPSLYKIEDTNDVLKYLMHEAEHWVSSAYIKEEFNKGGKGDKHVQFIKKFIENFINKIDNMSLEEKNEYYDRIEREYDMDQHEDSMGNSPFSRMDYILNKRDSNGDLTWEAVAEMVAIFRAEPAFRNFIYKEFGENAVQRLVRSIKDILNRAVKSINETMKTDLSEFTATNLAIAVENITEMAVNDKTFGDPFTDEQSSDPLGAKAPKNEVEMIDESLRYRRMKVRKPVYLAPWESQINSWNNAAYKFFKSKGFDYIKLAWDNDYVKKFHKKKMKNEEGVYYRTIEAVRNRFEPGRVFAVGLDYAGHGRKKGDARDQALTIWLKAKQDRNRIDLEMKGASRRIFNRIVKKMKLKDEDIKTLHRMFGNSLIHTLDESFEDTSLLNDILDSNDMHQKIDDEILRLVQQLDNTLSDAAIDAHGGINTYASEIAEFLHTGKVGRLALFENPFGRLGFMNKHNFELTQQLIALNQLKFNSKNDLQMLKKFRDTSAKNKSGNSYSEFIGVSRANAILGWEVDKDMEGNNQYKFDNITGNQVVFDERYVFSVVNEETMMNIDQSDEDVIILQEPNDRTGTLGLVAIVDNSFGYQPGIGSEISINNDGVSIPHDMFMKARAAVANTNGTNKDRTIRENSNIIRSNNRGYNDNKIMFTEEMLSKLKTVDNPVDTLYNAYGHNIQIQEGKAAIKWLIQEETMNITTEQEAEKLEKRISKGKPLPHFINFRLDNKMLKNYPGIRKTYKNAKGLSNVFGFNKKANMVHKTTAYQMIGYKRKALIRNKNFRYAERTWRNLVTKFKTSVAILSIKKIARDAVSSFSILTANDVPYTTIGKRGKQFVLEYPKLIQQRNEILAQQLELYSIPEKINGQPNPKYEKEKKKLESLQKKLQKNPIYPALQRGFIQSLSTSVLTIESDAVSDYQKQFNDIVELIDDIPKAKKYIMKLAKFGIGIEDIAKILKKGTDKTKRKLGSDYLEVVAKKFESIKSDEDLSAYLSELLGNPGNTEMMKIGGSLVMMVDVLLKWVLFNHYLEVFSDKKYNYMTETEKHDKAADLASRAAVKYHQNLPETLQTLSDVGIWMFPQFILQIQGVILGLLYRKFYSSSLQIGLSTSTGVFDESIFASAFPYKLPASLITQRDGNPLDPNMIYPDQLLKDVSSLF